MGKTPQIIASAYVGSGEKYGKQELQLMETNLLKTYPKLIRANLRYSGTEPLLRTMLESDNSYTEDDLARIAVEISRKAQELAKQPNGKIDILNCTRGGSIKVQ